MLHRKKEIMCPACTHTPTHTNIFKYSSLIFNQSYIKSGHTKKKDVDGIKIKIAKTQLDESLFLCIF